MISKPEWRVIPSLLIGLLGMFGPKIHTRNGQFDESRSQVDLEPFRSADADAESTTVGTDGCSLSLDVQLHHSTATYLNVESPWVHQWLKIRIGQIEVSDTRRKRG
jgi:hypothetical protein